MSDKVPELRFLGFDGEWEEDLLGLITDSFSGGTPSVGNASYYNGNIPFIRSGEINSTFTELYITEDGLSNSSAKIVEKGTILYALYGATSGEVGISKINGAINQAILAIIPKENYECYFIAQWLRKEKDVIINTFLQGGQGNLSGNIVKNLVIHYPSPPEQTQIGTLFQTLDTLLANTQQKHQKLHSLKKAMLTKMFPENGQTVPEVRFQGFSGEWVRKELGEITSYGNGIGHEDNQSTTGCYELINLNSISIDGGLKHSGKYVNFASETLLRDDLVMILSDVAHGNLLGRVAIIPESNKYVLNQRVARLRLTAQMDIQYLFTFINSEQKYFKQEGAGSSQLNISKKSVETFNVFSPTDLQEQTLIGNFFRELDQQISLQGDEIQSLKNLKQALLSKMFVS